MADFINKKYYENHNCAKYDFELFGTAPSSSSAATSTSNAHFFSGEDAKERMLSDNDDVIDVIVEPNILRKFSDDSSTSTSSLDMSNIQDNDSVIIDLKK